MTGRTVRRDAAIISYTVSGFVLLLWIARIVLSIRLKLWFDDAFMFYRYAWNVRHGLGVSWNPGVRTYGETAQLWGLIVWLLSYLPATASTVLLLGSWICSIAAVFAIAAGIARNAASEWMSSPWRVLALVAAPLALTPVFIRNTLNGMETLLGMAMIALFTGMVLSCRNGLVRPELCGVAGLLLALTRPEAVIVVLLFPLCLSWVLPGKRQGYLALMLSVFAGGMAVDLLACKLYFHTALPLSFYMKAHQGYEGYRHYWHPSISLLEFFAGCLPFLLLLAALLRKTDLRLLLAFFLPLFAVSAYLSTVLQVMGFYARYYVPYMPLVILPALLLLDRFLGEREKGVDVAAFPRSTGLARGVAGVVLVSTLGFAGVRNGVALAVDRHTERELYGYSPVTFNTASRVPLPELAWPLVAAVADIVVAPLPPGATVAASEVGYLGAAAPQVKVIDLEGLNDPRIALQGFRVGDLLAAHPDLIWLPHDDYTWQRGVILTDPGFFRDYELIAGALNSGIAIRKDSPNRLQLERNLATLWARLYPGLPISDYIATSATWTGQKSPALDN